MQGLRLYLHRADSTKREITDVLLTFGFKKVKKIRFASESENMICPMI